MFIFHTKRFRLYNVIIVKTINELILLQDQIKKMFTVQFRNKDDNVIIMKTSNNTATL